MDGSLIEKITIGKAELYLGNCLDVLALFGTKSISHIICDPPYEAEVHSSQRRVMRDGKLVSGMLNFSAMDETLRSSVSKEIVRLTNGWALVFCQLEGWHLWRDSLFSAGAIPDQPMIWNKPDGKPRFDGTGPAHSYEVIELVFCGEGRRVWNGGGARGVFNINKSENTRSEHATMKPQKLMKDLVGLFSNPDDLILDCFAGSGSTGVAAVTMGRRFIGIERDPEYFEICCRRIEEAQREGLLNTHYIKTKEKLTSPLLVEPPKVAAPKAPAAKASPKKSTTAPPGPRRPLISVGNSTSTRPSDSPDRAAKPPAPRRPFIDPFVAAHPVPDGERLAFDEGTWDWDATSATGCDVECFENFFLVCFKRFSDQKKLTFELSERCDLDRKNLEKIMINNCLITFNGNTYDVPMIYYALKGANCVALKHASDRIIKTGIKPWDIERELGIRIPKLDHIDLKEPNPSIQQSLKMLGARLHGRYIVDLPYPEDARLTRQQMNFTVHYCFHDIDDTQALFDALREPLELRVALGKEYGIDMRSKSDAQVGEAIVKKRVEAATGHKLSRGDSANSFQYIVPDFISFEDERLNAILRDLRNTKFSVDGSGKVEPPEWLEKLTIQIGAGNYSCGLGGLHSDEEHRAIHADGNNLLIDIDATGYYPNVIMKLGLYPKACGPTFLDIYGKSIKERAAAKARQQEIDLEIKILEKQLAEVEK